MTRWAVSKLPRAHVYNLFKTHSALFFGSVLLVHQLLDPQPDVLTVWVMKTKRYVAPHA